MTKGYEDCFTLNDKDKFGWMNIWPNGYCTLEAWFSEENGVIKKFRFKQKIASKNSSDFLSHYLYLVGALERLLTLQKIENFRKCHFEKFSVFFNIKI